MLNIQGNHKVYGSLANLPNDVANQIWQSDNFILECKKSGIVIDEKSAENRRNELSKIIENLEWEIEDASNEISDKNFEEDEEEVFLKKCILKDEICDLQNNIDGCKEKLKKAEEEMEMLS